MLLSRVPTSYHSSITRFFYLNRTKQWGSPFLGVITLPALLAYLQYFLPKLQKHTLRITTFQKYLASLKAFHTYNGLAWDLLNHPIVISFLKVEVHQIPQPQTKQGYCVTYSDLVKAASSTNLSNLDQVVTLTIAIVLFSSLGRVFEILHPASHPQMPYSCLQYDVSDYRIFLLRPKTTKTYSQFLFPIRLPSPINPQHWLIIYNSIRPSSSPNLWCSTSGERISSSWFLTSFKELASLPPSVTLDCTSFRSGGATYLSDKVPMDKIILLGRWDSNAYIRYMRQLPSTMFRLLSF